MMSDPLYVIAVISNPCRYKSRSELFKKFKLEMEAQNVKLLVVEVAYGDRPFEICCDNNPYHIRMCTNCEIWHKENMINIGVRNLTRLHPDWKYMAWIDADITFLNKSWYEETIHQLQHYKVVQLFQTAIDLGPKGEAFGRYDSFAWGYVQGNMITPTKKYVSFHPGYAWAMTRDAYDALGGLIEAPLGAGDRHMAYGLVGMMKDSINPLLHPRYSASMFQWELRAERHIKRSLGYVDGTIVHHWHGKKADRRYHDRWRILIDNQFNPDTDIKYDSYGLLNLEVGDVRQMKLRDAIMGYFRARSEDSIDPV